MSHHHPHDKHPGHPHARRHHASNRYYRGIKHPHATSEPETPVCKRPDSPDFIAARDAILTTEFSAGQANMAQHELGELPVTLGSPLGPDYTSIVNNGWGPRPDVAKAVPGATAFHRALDLVGSPEVHAAAKGRVIYSGHFDNPSGNAVLVLHANQMLTGYSHLKDGSIRVKPGDMINDPENTLLGIAGQTGCAHGDGLHFTVRVPRSSSLWSDNMAAGLVQDDHESTSVLTRKFDYPNINPPIYGRTWDWKASIPPTLEDAQQLGLVPPSAPTATPTAPAVLATMAANGNSPGPAASAPVVSDFTGLPLAEQAHQAAVAAPNSLQNSDGAPAMAPPVAPVANPQTEALHTLEAEQLAARDAARAGELASLQQHKGHRHGHGHGLPAGSKHPTGHSHHRTRVASRHS